jgi:AcrR family transcriptional regulator
MESRPKTQSSDLRLRLLKTASDIISQHGLKKLTLRELSHRVGVSRTAPYRHFKNKEALLMAIAQDGFNKLTVEYQKINRDKSLDAFSKLHQCGLAYIKFAITNPGVFRLMFSQQITQLPRSSQLRADADQTYKEFLKAVTAFQQETNIASDKYLILANYSWATVHGLANLLIDSQIHVSGNNYGLPTLLTNDLSNIQRDVQSMIEFSKQTLMNFLDLILNGLSSKGDRS